MLVFNSKSTGARNALVLISLLCCAVQTFSFQMPQVYHRRQLQQMPQMQQQLPQEQRPHKHTVLFASKQPDERKKKSNRGFWLSLKRRVSPLVVVMFPFITTAVTTLFPHSAEASAPVMALPKAEGRDPASEALSVHDRQMVLRKQQQLQEQARQAREIEATQGEAARIKFEQGLKQKELEDAAARQKGLKDLKLSLLEQGIDPSTDVEGKRQTILYERGVDLGKVSGTPYYLEKEFEEKSPKRSFAYKKQLNRQVIALMVQDMKNRGVDPIEYFEQRQDQTLQILDLSPAQAGALVAQYQANMEKYGQITVPKPGELSALEKMKQAEDPEELKRIEKEEAKRAKEEAKRAKEEAKAKAKEEKARAQAEAKAAKEEAKRLKEEAKKSAAAAAAAAASAVAESEETDASMEVAEDGEAAGMEMQEVIEEETAPVAVTPAAKKSSPIVPIAGALVAAGGGAYALKMYRDKAARDEEERQKQFRILMGLDKEKDTSKSAPALEETDVDMTAIDGEVKAAPAPKPSPTPAPEVEAPKKKRIGLKNVFGKKKGGRETDIKALVSEDASAPEFASTLAKILTFGAPGRFPAVQSLPGEMPMESFDLESAKQILTEARETSGLSLEESAEAFANVVNCMLIDIVDLASTSLKEKEDQVTVDALNIVVDFMNHAASLYDSVAEGVSISPVTYSGSLSKSKLEQMYGAYAISGMMNLDKMSDDFENRVALLQDVFQISEKKAEGLMMKAMQKNMMKMLKDGEGMEGMEEMLKGMQGLGGMPGLDGDGEGPSPEQLKEMLFALKEMKDSGSIPKDEFENVKKQFKEAFGSSIDDVVKEASSNNEELSSTDKELLELMKAIMDD